MIKYLEKAYFNVYGSKQYFEGYYNPNYNKEGHAFPYFTKEISNQIVRSATWDDNTKVIFDEQEQNYKAIFEDDNGNEILRTVLFDKKSFHKKDGSKIYCYAICSKYWNWHAYTLEKIPKEDDSIIIANIKNLKTELKKECIEMDY